MDGVEVVHGPALEFLEHATLVDTPGLGNEAAEHEAVARFLHLCHVLVITIDGRRPFADKEKDFELLDTAFNRLAGVPKILVVTSAEEFLTSRRASFETGWQPEVAEAFWNEAIERLRRDPRFRDHLNRFRSVPRFFVDSKEGFRIEEVRDCVLPIVTDDAHRSRISEAQARYVLETATDALTVLLDYISTRSNNLNRLRMEAEQRAQGTATAVGEVLESLERSFASIKARLQESRQGIPMGGFAIETIVTGQAITESQGSTVRELEEEIRGVVTERVANARKPTWRRVKRHCEARVRRWFRHRDQVDVDGLLVGQFEAGMEGTKLKNVSRKCARAMVVNVNQQLTAALANASHHLTGGAEAWEIGSSAHDIESSLERFQIKHDDNVRSFYAYISAPKSSDLLREHGFVGFDASGEQVVRTESVNALSCIGFAEISQASESCKDRLRLLGRKEADGFNGSQEEDAESVGETMFGDAYCEQVAREVDAVCGRRVSEFIADVSRRIDTLVKGVTEERSRFRGARARIWSARGTFAGRVLVVVVLLFIGGLVFEEVAPDQLARLLSMLADRMFETVVGGVLTTLVVLGALYVISGAKNENLRRALRPVLCERWKARGTRRELSAALKAHFDESYDRLVADLGELPLRVEQAIAQSVVERLKNHSEVIQKGAERLSELRRLIVARCSLLDEFIGIVNQHLDGIPKELRETAGEVKKHAIEEHMSRIRKAASSVEDVKLEVERAAEVAKRRH